MAGTPLTEQALYAALSKTYRANLLKAMQNAGYTGPLNVFEPPPLLRVDNRLQLSTRTEYITTRSGTLQGIALEVYGAVQQEAPNTKGTWAQPARMLRRENVPYTTSRKEQARILRAMCDIVAVQEQADYRLLKAFETLPAHKEHLRPKKGKYG